MSKNEEEKDFIRVMDTNDLELVFSWRNHPDISSYMLTQHSITREEHQLWFERATESIDKQLLIYERNGIPSGFVSFTNTFQGGVSDWGFYTAPGATKGTGLRLGNAALSYGFNSIGLHKVCGQVVVTNDASVRMHCKLGFREEGVLRDQFKSKSGYINLICFGLIHNEWLF